MHRVTTVTVKKVRYNIMEEFTSVVSSLGFPIAVACYALWSSHKHEIYLQGILDNTLKENTKAIDRLSDLIDGGLMWVKNGNIELTTKEE